MQPANLLVYLPHMWFEVSSLSNTMKSEFTELTDISFLTYCGTLLNFMIGLSALQTCGMQVTLNIFDCGSLQRNKFSIFITWLVVQASYGIVQHECGTLNVVWCIVSEVTSTGKLLFSTAYINELLAICMWTILCTPMILDIPSSNHWWYSNKTILLFCL